MTKIFLLLAALILYLVGGFYGINPKSSVAKVLNMLIFSNNSEHVFRALMGIYWGMATLFVMGALNDRYTRPALVALITFMLGAAAGRLLSLGVDGVPQAQFLSISILMELMFAFAGWHFLRKGGRLG